MAATSEISTLQGFFNRMLLKSSAADIKDMLAEGQMGKAFENVEAGAQPMAGSEFVTDMFAPGERNGVATAEEVKVGPAEAATGANAEKQIAHYSPNQVTQHGTTAAATQIGQLVSAVSSMGKALSVLHRQNMVMSAGLTQLLEKSIAADATAAAKAVPATTTPVAKSDDKPFEKDDEKDDEKAKSLMVAKASAEFTVAKGLVTQAEELEGDGRAGTAKSRRTEAQAALAKAQTLLGAASALGATGEAFDSLSGAITTFAKAKSMECANQAHYPDSHKGDETAKGGAPDEAALVKAQANVLAKAAEIEAALSGLALLKTDVQGMLAIVSGKSRVPGGPPDVTALAKSDPDGYARAKSTEMMALQDQGLMDTADVVSAHEIIGKMQAVAKGLVPATAVTSRIAGASTAVRSLFADAA